MRFLIFKSRNRLFLLIYRRKPNITRCNEWRAKLARNSASGNTVTGCWRATALDVPENRNTGFDADVLFDPLCDIDSRCRTFCNNDHVVRKAVEPSVADLFDNILFKAEFALRDQNRSCADSQTDIQGQMARMATHDLYDGATLMRLHGVTELVDAFNGSVCGSVETDAIICAGDVVVDRCRDTDNADAVLRKSQCAAECAVTADRDDAVKTKQLAGADSFVLPCFGHKFITPGGVEDRTAAIDNMRNALFVQLDDITVDQTVIASADAYDFNTAEDRRSDDRTHGGIHAGGVAAAGENADPADCIFFFIRNTSTNILSQKNVIVNRKIDQDVL